MDTEMIKEKILKEIAKTEKVLAKSKEMAKPNRSAEAVGRVSRMNDINHQTISFALENQSKAKLASLKKILEKVGTPEFGLCLKCKKKIAMGRILIRPESLLCVKCAR
ncbi:MAG: hypothetical protein KGZ59_05235 [Chitinophagaceae bacterium]|nr:hypothetical protein [Chitinophagaceae bacterium]MBS4043200.1 hypothetical protein [Chitinophagaceae bacterium]